MGFVSFFGRLSKDYEVLYDDIKGKQVGDWRGRCDVRNPDEFAGECGWPGGVCARWAADGVGEQVERDESLLVLCKSGYAQAGPCSSWRRRVFPTRNAGGGLDACKT